MTVDEIYELIGQNVYNAIPEDEEWEKAVLFIRGDDNSVGYNGEYYSNGKRSSLELADFDWDVDDAIMELHKIMTPTDKSNPWNRAVFTLLPSGEFNMEFSLVEEEEE